MIDDISPPGSWVRELSARPHTYRDVWAALREAEARIADLHRELALAHGTGHPGYVIGQHWLSVAYSRICAGEPEAQVLEDYGVGKAAAREAT